MDIRSLELFLHLSESLHFGQTSQAKHISASALTRTIQQLEEKLATQLFERDNRTVKLTQAGKLFQQYATRSINQWQHLKTELMQQKQVLQGEISIYCSVTASYSFLHNTLRQFRNAYPSIHIILHTGDPENAINRVKQGQEDIAISAKPGNYPDILTFKRLISTPLLIIGPAALGTNTPNWADTPMILPERGLVRDHIDDWFRKIAIKPSIYAQVSGNEAIVSMVSLGFGYGVVPQTVLHNSPLANKVNVITHEPILPAIDVGFFTQKKNLNKPIIQAAWDTLST